MPPSPCPAARRERRRRRGHRGSSRRAVRGRCRPVRRRAIREVVPPCSPPSSWLTADIAYLYNHGSPRGLVQPGWLHHDDHRLRPQSYTGIDDLSVSLDDGVLSVTMNRPDSLNSLTAAMFTTLADALEQAAADPRVKVVRLGGAGRGFCSGAGISADDQAQKSADGRRLGARRGEPRGRVDRRICRNRWSPSFRARRPASGSRWRWPATSYWLRRRRFSCWPSPRSA